MTLSEIKTTVEALSPEERVGLLRLFLRRTSADPPPATRPESREFWSEQVRA